MPHAQIARELGCSRSTVKKDCATMGVPNNPLSHRGQAQGRRNPHNHEAAGIVRREEAFHHYLTGMTLAAVGRAMGVTAATVRIWIDQEVESRINPLVEQLRAIGNARLDHLRVRAMQIVDSADGELRLKAIDRVLQIERRWSALNGADSPVRVDAVVTQQTEVDREMQELLREAQARNAMIEGEIVGDPDPAT
jgi:predicted transcriptional regulator